MKESCQRFRDMMWENELSEEFWAHLEECPECKNEYELIKKTREALAKKESLTPKIMSAVRREKRQRTISLTLKYAAVFIVVLAVGIFGRLALNSGMKSESDRYYSPEFVSGVTANDGNLKYDAAEDSDLQFSQSESILWDEPMEAPEASMEEPEAPMEEPCAPAPSSPANDRIEAEAERHPLDRVSKDYKKNQGITLPSADIVIAGGDIKGVCDLLSEWGAEIVADHIEIQGNCYVEAVTLLTKEGFDTAFERVQDGAVITLIMFSDYLE